MTASLDGKESGYIKSLVIVLFGVKIEEIHSAFSMSLESFSISKSECRINLDDTLSDKYIQNIILKLKDL